MNEQIRISFSNSEASALAELQQAQAPQASELLWGLLETPFVGRALHAIYAGPAVMIAIPERHGEPRGGQIPVENETDHPEPGDVLLVPPVPDLDGGADEPADGVTVAIFYGEGGRPFTPAGWQPGVVVAKVTEGLDALREACRSTRWEGAKQVTLARMIEAAEVREAVIYADGASLGNPGPAGAGFLIETRDGQLLAEGSIPLEPTTVNVAEYRALIAGLGEAHRLGISKIEARLDSELVCRQLSGQYRVKARHLQPLYQWARKLIGRFDDFNCIHLGREHNERADALAGDAAKRAKEQSADDRE